MLRCLTRFCLILAVGVVSSRAAVLIPFDSTWNYWKGQSEASSPDPAAWRLAGFDDASWPSGAGAFFYENQPGGGTSYTGNTDLTDMFGGYTSLFLRRTFVVTNVNDLSELQLSGISDDGFLAWINGTNIARFNMPDGEIPFDGTALGALSEPVPVQNFVIADPRSFLVAGTNVLAVHAFNASLNQSSDFIINVSLSGTTDTTPPTVIDRIPPAQAILRSLSSIEVGFSEDVTGVDASDLLINGAPSTNVTAFNATRYVFTFPPAPAGPVQVSWKTGHGIQDRAGTPNAFAGGNWSYTVDPNAPPPGVEISEFMADNDRTINDEDGDASDWIEIHNAGPATANLGGWFLTDQPGNLSKWRFPNISLAPDGYLLLFASGKNRTNPLARLHTNFQLDKNAGYLALADSGTNVISEFPWSYPQQYGDISYGRAPGASTLVGYFSDPTPGAANSISGPGFAPAVAFSRPGGTFATGFALALTTASTNAVIHYTLDGSPPLETSLIYSGPIPVSGTVQVRARAFEPGLLPGPLRSESYVLLAANVLNFTSDLPLLIIHNFGAGSVPASVSQFAYVAVFEPGASGKSSLTNPPALSTRSGINLRGSSTLGLAKSSFAVEFHDEFDADRKLSPLGLPEDSDWVLYAPNFFEPILIHNPLAYGLSNQIGRYAPRTRFVEVYVNTGGGAISSANYNGIYVLEEKIKQGRNRVNVDKLEPEHVNPPEVTGGYLAKVDRVGPGENGFSAGGQSMAYVEPGEVEIELPQRTPQRQYLSSYLNAFGNALNSSGFTNLTTGYPAYVDVDAWIDHHILNVMAFNVDALRLSAYFYKPRNGRLAFGPVWDFDRALGSTDGRDANPRVWRSQSGDLGTDFFNYTWWGRMFQDPDFWQRWIDRWQELRLGPFSTASLNATIDGFCNEVRSAQPRELARWGVQPRGGSYQGEIDYTKGWLASRVNFIDTNFLAKPVFSRGGGPITAGFTLTLTGPAGATIYYTLDGTDPRLPGGALSSRAAVYSGPVALNNNARVVARARDLAHVNLTGANNPPLSSPWSGPTAATFVVQTPPLVITELMYHPAPPPAGNTNDADNFEYLELKNRGAGSLNLMGFRFTNGIDFTFTTNSSVTNLAAGQRVLLVKNRTAFVSRYPGAAANIAGEYLGGLDNAGERLALVGPLLEPIHDFRYENSWYPITDGLGFSLVIVDESAALDTWTNRNSWRPSGGAAGSPGLVDPAPPVLPRILVNEALTHTDPPLLDAIELYNPTAAAANIGGWFLSDTFSQPGKFRIPDGTTIPAGGYRVFDETDFNNGSPGSFRLSSLGDDVFLFSGDAATNLSGYYHGFSFGAAQNPVSFGRHVTSTGAEHFVAQSVNTLGSANAGPRVGPIVINEILFQPPPVGTNNNTLDEFIELQNITGLTVPLFDPAAPTNTWKLSGGVEYLFPANLSLSPGAFLLIVNFDPAANPAQAAAFRSRYGAAGATLLGPYGSSLDNSGERISLSRPDPPQTIPDPYIGFVPYVLVDRVDYSTTSPWPTNASGTGNSLQRIFANAYGNDPANWRGGAPTAGAPNPGGGSLDTDGDGLPDDWERAHGLDPGNAGGDDGASGDPDRDGLTNLQEYQSGTNPQDPASALRIESVALVAGATRIQFNAVAGWTYSVQYQTNVAAIPWMNLTNVPGQSVPGPVTVSDPATTNSGSRYYRLVTPQVP